MKKIIIAILVAAVLMSACVPALAASKKVVTTGSVNLRSGPGLDYSKLGAVKKGVTLK